ncbi:MAG: hypothetical protein C0402_16345, partial [Thermodesulfovibrio sp.]|nr:hypothetical protein [Thermodesulfovibrio sp.]
MSLRNWAASIFTKNIQPGESAPTAVLPTDAPVIRADGDYYHTWSPKLLRMADDINSLSATTEREFMGVGEKLHSFAERFNE